MFKQRVRLRDLYCTEQHHYQGMARFILLFQGLSQVEHVAFESASNHHRSWWRWCHLPNRPCNLASTGTGAGGDGIDRRNRRTWSIIWWFLNIWRNLKPISPVYTDCQSTPRYTSDSGSIWPLTGAASIGPAASNGPAARRPLDDRPARLMNLASMSNRGRNARLTDCPWILQV